MRIGRDLYFSWVGICGRERPVGRHSGRWCEHSGEHYIRIPNKDRRGFGLCLGGIPDVFFWLSKTDNDVGWDSTGDLFYTENSRNSFFYKFVMNAENRIIKTLDNPLRLLFWDLRESMLLIFFVSLGGFLGSLTIILFGIALWWFSRQFNKLAKKKGITPFHYVYWHVPTKVLRRSGNFSSFPCSHKRKLILWTRKYIS